MYDYEKVYKSKEIRKDDDGMEQHSLLGITMRWGAAGKLLKLAVSSVSNGDLDKTQQSKH